MILYCSDNLYSISILPINFYWNKFALTSSWRYSVSFSRRLWFLKGKTWQQDHSYIQRLSSERRSQPYKSQNFYKHGLKNHRCFRYDLMLWPNVKGDHNKMLEPEWDNEHWLNWTIMQLNLVSRKYN